MKRKAKKEEPMLTETEIENRVLKEMILKMSAAQGAAAPVAKVKAQPAADTVKPNRNWKKETHTCPKCNAFGTIHDVFGIRMVRGVEQKQSYCRDCRAKLNYHSAPRKYRQRTP